MLYPDKEVTIAYKVQRNERVV